MGNLHEDQYTLIRVITPRSVLLRMRHAAKKSCRENKNAHFILNNCFFRKSCPVRDNVDRPQTTIWRMRIACWITKATNTHPEYIILIAFQRTNGCKNAPPCYVLRTFPVLMDITSFELLIKTNRKF
jgi:hypothetical protein